MKKQIVANHHITIFTLLDEYNNESDQLSNTTVPYLG